MSFDLGHKLADVGALFSAVTAFVLSYAAFLDTLEKLVLGALAIALLVLRIRSHLRRDAAERREGLQ